MSVRNVLFDGLLSEARPDRNFAIIPDGRIFRYHDVIQISAKYANVLVEWGVVGGDRVAVQVPKSIEAVILYLATIRAGAVFLPLNTAYTPSEVEYFLDNATPRVFICDHENHQQYRQLATSLNIRLETLGLWQSGQSVASSLLQSAQNASPNFKTVARQAQDLAAILYTSGTTGRSKGAMLTHENLLSNAQSLRRFWHFTSDDVLLHALPIFHTHGLFVAINITLISSASVIFLPKFETQAVIENLPQATTVMGVPTFYTRLLAQEKFNKNLVQHMRLFISGSAPLLAETHIQFEKTTGHRILERYGMTETNMNTSNPYEGERRAGTVGLPLPHVELRIVDADTGKSVEGGQIGMIEVKGPNVFAGYWQMEQKTREEFRDDGFFITGDLGVIDEYGYVKIVGRSKDLIISGGFNIYPKEVELVIDELDAVGESAVIGVPHEDFGEAVVAIVVANGGSHIDENTLLETIKPKIARFKQPKRIVIVEELPRNTMGKVQKNVLRRRFENLLTKVGD